MSTEPKSIAVWLVFWALVGLMFFIKHHNRNKRIETIRARFRALSKNGPVTNPSTRRNEERNKPRRSMALMAAGLITFASGPFVEACTPPPEPAPVPAPDMPPHTSVFRRLDRMPNSVLITVSGPEGWAKAKIECQVFGGASEFYETKNFYWAGDTTGDFDDFATFGRTCPWTAPNLINVETSEWD